MLIGLVTALRPDQSAEVLVFDGTHRVLYPKTSPHAYEWAPVVVDGASQILGPEEVGAFEAIAGRVGSLRKLLEAEFARRRQEQTTAEAMGLLLGYPDFQRYDEPTRQVPAELARGNLLRLLARAFPGQVFAAEVDGPSVRLEWIDGPTIEEVESIAETFLASEPVSGAAGGADSLFTQLFGWADGVHCRRVLSPHAVSEIARELGFAGTPADLSESTPAASQIRRTAATRSFLPPRRVVPALERSVDDKSVTLLCRGLPYPAEVRRLAAAGFSPKPDNLSVWSASWSPDVEMSGSSLAADPAFRVFPTS